MQFSNKRVNFSQINPLQYYELTIPTSLPLYLILACHGSEVGIVSSIGDGYKGLLD